ncbi:MAG TPA: undecaprenyldiphospho-muramoylpentapeptide beta-N-acetylglucosaminyltransferase [Armatimonadota bacterium]|nr:undecaprenyldiphospho-muramoylpentapeptide beta-N-acetylglucosaminyltransferase [Armatimonadota bacterium]
MTTAEGSGPKIVLTGGGTGGHVYPALAVAGAVRKLAPQSEILYIGGDRVEARAAPAAGLPFRAISVHGLAGSVSLGQRLRSLAELAVGLPLVQSLRILRGFGANVVLGTGGYVSGPVLLGARLAGVPSAALDGNRVPGHTSKIVSRLVDVMAVAHPEMERFFAARVRRGARVEMTGLPVRPEIVATSREEGASALGLDSSLRTVLVFGGSLGSRRMNEALTGALQGLADKDWAGDIQVLHVTGRRFSVPEQESKGLAVRYRAVPYLEERYASALAAADLVISRAGAGTVAEVTARGLPAVLSPWSEASTGEQAFNAEPLRQAGAAVVIPDAELTPERLAEVLIELLSDPARLKRMADASKRLGRPGAAERVAELVLELAARGRG